MRNVLIFLCLCYSISISGATYYVTTTGSNSNTGTSVGTAWATWQYGMTHLSAGDILYIRAGTYKGMYSSNYGVSIKSTSGRGSDGTASSHILVSAYPGDANPVLDCSGLTGSGEHDGILIENTQYWDFTGLTVINTKERGSGQPAPGWTLSDCSHITLNQCILHDNDNGFISYWGNDIHYNNCDSYHNGETALYYGNNGFYGCVKGGGTTYWYGCRAYLNGQDGFDSFAQNGGDGFLYWDKCWAFSNATWHGSSSGFKQGLSGVAPTTANPMRILTNCIAADMPCGYDESQDAEVEKHAYSYPHAMYNCISFNNDVAFAFDVAGGIDGKESTDIIKNCISYGDKYVSYIGFGNNTVDHNSWNIRTMTSGDFQSTDISQLSASRQADGSLPVTTFMHLSTSATPFIDSGIDVGLPYTGQGPDIGAFEMESGSTTNPVPVYTSSVVENATPNLLQMTYNIPLANIVPSASAFSVIVNSEVRGVNSIAISGTRVQLTLVNAIKYGDIVTISYTKPGTNPIQTTSGETATGISVRTVTNNCLNIAPTTEITSPIFNSSFKANENIIITATALDTDGSISLVEFYNGGTKLGSKSATPYSYIWNNVPAGTYSLTVVATDNFNSKTTSSAITISVTNAAPNPNKHPLVRISNPGKGNIFENLSSITIDAVASDPDGLVTKVEFFNGEVRLVELTSSPYSFTWKDVKAGSYSITAIATDNSNDTTISLPVEFVVGSKVKYDANSDIIKLYPNPNDGHFSIAFINPLQNKKSDIVITDMAGKQVYNGPVLKEETVKHFDLSDSKAGIYIIMIRDKEILVTKKFIKK